MFLKKKLVEVIPQAGRVPKVAHTSSLSTRNEPTATTLGLPPLLLSTAPRKSYREEAMGTLGGHVAPGAFFIIISQWHLFAEAKLERIRWVCFSFICAKI